jgi:hypothetical protein
MKRFFKYKGYFSYKVAVTGNLVSLRIRIARMHWTSSHQQFSKSTLESRGGHKKQFLGFSNSVLPSYVKFFADVAHLIKCHRFLTIIHRREAGAVAKGSYFLKSIFKCWGRDWSFLPFCFHRRDENSCDSGIKWILFSKIMINVSTLPC